MTIVISVRISAVLRIHDEPVLVDIREGVKGQRVGF